MGWPAEDQRLLLVLGRYVSVYKYLAPVAAGRAKRHWVLQLLSGAQQSRAEGRNVHQPGQWQHL